MDYTIFNNTYNHNENEFILQFIIAKNISYPEFCFGIIAKKPPKFIETEIGVKKFYNKFVTENGNVINESERQENDVSLDGLIALWIPQRDRVLKYLLHAYYKKVKSGSDLNKNNITKNDIICKNEISINELAILLSDKKVLLFTGAGISIKAGVVDLKGLGDISYEIFQPVDAYYKDIINMKTDNRKIAYKKFYSMLTESQPTKSHYIIKKLCDTHNFVLATGNIDGLHEKTGIKPIFQNSDEVVIPNIDSYDILLTVGLSDEGIGSVAKKYKSQRSDGMIISINKDIPCYLTEKDSYILGDCEYILERMTHELIPKR